MPAKSETTGFPGVPAHCSKSTVTISLADWYRMRIQHDALVRVAEAARELCNYVCASSMVTHRCADLGDQLRAAFAALEEGKK